MQEKNGQLRLRQQLARRLFPVTLGIGLLISLGMPGIYCIIESAAMRRSATMYAQEFAEQLSQFSLQTPTLWKHQASKYIQVLSQFLIQKDVISIRVMDENSQPIAAYAHVAPQAEAWWNRSAPQGTAPISFNNRQIGSVQVEVSRGSLFAPTLILFLFSTTAGVGLAILGYRFPVKVVAGMEGQIEELVATVQQGNVESERLRATAEAAAERFRGLVETIDAIVWEADATTFRYTFMSQQAVKILGYPVEQWRTEADFWIAHLHPEDREMMVAAYRAAVAEGRPHEFEYRMMAADGRVIWLRDLVHVVPEQPGHPQLLRGVTLDVTGRRGAEERLRAFGYTLESIGEMVTVTDLEDRLTFVNQAFLNTYGYTRQEILGQHVSLLWSPNTSPGVHQQVLAQSRAGRWRGELLNRAKAGREFPIALSVSNIQDPSGNIVGLVGIAEDITERKRLEGRLEKLNECLLSFGVDPRENVNRLVGLCGEQLGAACALYNRLEDGKLCAWGQWNAPADFNPVDTPDGHICYDVIRGNQNESRIIRHLPQTGYAQTDPNVMRYGLQTYIGQPVAFGDIFVGSLCVLYQEDRHPSSEDLKLLGIAAAAIGVEERRRQAEQALVARTRQLETLRTIGEEITRELDLTTLLELITRRAIELVGGASGTVFLWDEEARVLVPRAWHGLGEWRREVRLRLGEGIGGVVAERREGIIVNDYRNWPYAVRPTLEHTGTTAGIGEPLLYRDRFLGVFTAHNAETGRPFTESDHNILALFAAQAAIAIENARLFEASQRGIAERIRAEEALVARTRQLEALRAIGEEITRELELPTLLGLLTRRAVELVDAGSGGVHLWDEEAQVAIPQAWHGELREWQTAVRYKPGEGVVGSVVLHRQGLIVNDYQHSIYAHPLFVAHTGIAAVLAEPLLYQDRLLGVIAITREETEHPFTQDDQRLLRLFAAQAAIAIENARLHSAAIRRGEELEALLRAMRSVMSGLDLQGILNRIVEEAAQIAGCPHVKVLLLDRSAEVLRAGAVKGTTMPLGYHFPLGSDRSSHVAKTGEPVYNADSPSDPRNPFAEADRELGVLTYLGLPIKSRDEVLGVLTFNTTTPRSYSPDEVAYLTSFADQAAIAIENARLYADLKRAYEDVQRAQEELVRAEKLRALGTMAAGIAHDLNNMLAAILGQVELLQLQTPEPEVRERLRMLETAATDGAQVVRRLQGFARQRPTGALVECDLAALVSEAVEFTRPRWRDDPQRRGVRIEVRTSLGALPPILGHAPEVREVLINLILNAVDAMPMGGVLTLTGDGTPKGVTLTVADTGIGMPDQVRERIFEPFFTTKGVLGTGLGLSVVYGIMERHGGHIAVASTPGEGTTFTLRFQAAHGTAAAVPVVAPPPLPSRRLLLIDDDPAVRQTVASLLRTAGHIVLEAEGGPTGLARLAEGSVDLVLTDLGMPEMTGWDVARGVRAVDPHLPVVLLTGWGDSLAVDREERKLVAAIVSKPFRLDEIQTIIGRLTK